MASNSTLGYPAEVSICEPKVMNEKDSGSIIRTCSKAETTQIPTYNRTDKYCGK